MRQFKIKEWEYAVTSFDRLAKKKRFADRFRLEYYVLRHSKSGMKERLTSALLNIAGFLSEFRYLVIGQLTRPMKIPVNTDFIVILSKNPSFLKTILPIAEMLLCENQNVVFMCQANHFAELSKQMKPEIVQKMLPAENISWHTNRVSAFFRLTGAFFLGVFDSVWFAFQKLNHSGTLSFAFGRYALVSHYFDKGWLHFFNSGKVKVLTADDKYLWESLLLSCTKSSSSASYVFQHGKISDIYYPTFGTYFCTWGQNDQKSMLDTYKALPEELICIGSPYFDNVYQSIVNKESVEKIERVYISFLAQPFYRILKNSVPIYNEVLSWFYRLATSKEFKHKFIIKPHPHDHLSFYDSRPSNIDLVNENILKVLEESLIMVTVDSTSMLEAAVCKVPSVQLLPVGHNTFADDSATGISLKAETYEEFEAIMTKLYYDETAYAEALDHSSKALNYYFENLGHSVDKIREMLIND